MAVSQRPARGAATKDQSRYYVHILFICCASWGQIAKCFLEPVFRYSRRMEGASP